MISRDSDQHADPCHHWELQCIVHVLRGIEAVYALLFDQESGEG